MECDETEVNYTKNKKIVEAIKLLENREDYMISNSDVNEAIETLLEYVRRKIK